MCTSMLHLLIMRVWFLPEMLTCGIMYKLLFELLVLALTQDIDRDVVTASCFYCNRIDRIVLLVLSSDQFIA